MAYLCFTSFTVSARDGLSITSNRINFSTSHPDRVKYQNLLWRGGVSLKSSNPSFGGLSGIELSKGGKKMLAVSDNGLWIQADIIYKNAKISHLTNAKIVHLRNPKGKVFVHWRADSEGLTKRNDSLDDVIVSVERDQAIYRYKFGEKGLRTPALALGAVNEAANISPNRGLEAITSLPKTHAYRGWLLTFAEKKLNQSGNHSGWLVNGKSNLPIYVKRTKGYDITDASYLPNGDIVILERALSLFTGPSMRVRQFCGSNVKPNATLSGKTLIDANWLYSVDNMEGLAVHTAPNGETVLTLVSDNNYHFLQRTLMLQFALANERSIC